MYGALNATEMTVVYCDVYLLKVAGVVLQIKFHNLILNSISGSRSRSRTRSNRILHLQEL